MPVQASLELLERREHDLEIGPFVGGHEQPTRQLEAQCDTAGFPGRIRFDAAYEPHEVRHAFQAPVQAPGMRVEDLAQPRLGCPVDSVQRKRH